MHNKPQSKFTIAPVFSLALTLFSLGFLQSCNPCAIQKGPKGNHVQYEIKKTGCFGSCPVYNMYVFADGDAFLYAKNFVDDPGMFTRKLTESEYKKLCKAFKNSHFSKLEDSYGSNVADLPSIYITMHYSKGSKTILAKDGVPQSLITISSIFEKFRTSGGWKKIFVDPAKERFDTRYLVVNVAKEADLDLIEQNYTKYNLKRTDRLAPKLMYWEMQFAKDSIDPELMFFLLRKDPLVREVTFIRANGREPKAGGKS